MLQGGFQVIGYGGVGSIEFDCMDTVGVALDRDRVGRPLCIASCVRESLVLRRSRQRSGLKAALDVGAFLTRKQSQETELATGLTCSFQGLVFVELNAAALAILCFLLSRHLHYSYCFFRTSVSKG